MEEERVSTQAHWDCTPLLHHAITQSTQVMFLAAWWSCLYRLQGSAALGSKEAAAISGGEMPLQVSDTSLSNYHPSKI